MKFTKSRRIIFAYAFAGVVLFANILPLYGNNLTNKHEFSVEKSDSSKVNTQESAHELNNTKKEKIESTKSTTELNYNIVYYLISKIIQIITISRQQ
jgi:hypothetical protein